MKPSFLLWMRQIGYFPYFFLADLSIASIAVTATLYLWGTIDIFGLLGAYATLVLVEYVTAYLIYRIKNPVPTGIYFLGSDDPFMFSQEELEDHINNFGRSRGKTNAYKTILNAEQNPTNGNEQ